MGMEFWLRAAAIAVCAYFAGCFNGAVIVSKYIIRDDVRNHGSGNAGLTNFYRTFGGALTFVVILCDVLKAVLAVWVGIQIAGGYSVSTFLGGDLVVFGKYWAGLFCMVGHMFPWLFSFRGGKGVLSGGTIAIMIDWRVALIVWGGFLILVVITRYVSLGSCYAGASFPFATWFVFQNLALTLMGILMGGMLVYMHRANIKRLLSGTESKFSFRKKKS